MLRGRYIALSANPSPRLKPPHFNHRRENVAQCLRVKNTASLLEI